MQEAHRESESDLVIVQMVSFKVGVLILQNDRSLLLSSVVQPQNIQVQYGSDQLDRALNKLTPALNVSWKCSQMSRTNQ